MNNIIHLRALFLEAERTLEQKLALFSLLNLGILESLASGLVSATDALRIFFNAENCLVVRQHLRDSVADEIMSHGTQLPDLFEVLPAADAQREFQRELATMRSLCLALLEEKRLAA
jgi:hypothetical protein